MVLDLSTKGVDEHVRTFVAVEPPPSEQARLGSLEGDFSSHSSVLNWVSPGLIHITVRFLGNISASSVGLVQDAVRESAGRSHPFALRLTHIGAFPNERMPRIIWVGLAADDGLRALQELHAELENELAARRFPRDPRAFSPHITLARTRDRCSPAEHRALGETVAALKENPEVEGTFEVVRLTVMRSDLSPNGPVYTPLALVPLATDQK
jgi:2'-5' RNA ligase